MALGLEVVHVVLLAAQRVRIAHGLVVAAQEPVRLVPLVQRNEESLLGEYRGDVVRVAPHLDSIRSFRIPETVAHIVVQCREHVDQAVAHALLEDRGHARREVGDGGKLILERAGDGGAQGVGEAAGDFAVHDVDKGHACLGVVVVETARRRVVQHDPVPAGGHFDLEHTVRELL